MQKITDPGRAFRRKLAKERDLSFIDSLQRRFSNQVGFIPRPGLLEAINGGLVTIGQENADNAAYILIRRRLRSAPNIRPITQVAVCMDAQRRGLGLSMIESVCAHAYAELFEAVQCWVREDLEAVDFFKTANFSIICSRDPQSRRQRRLLLMRRSLQHFQPANFWKPPTVAGATPRMIAGQELRLYRP